MTKEQTRKKIEFLLSGGPSKISREMLISFRGQLTYKETLSVKQLRCLEEQYQRWIQRYAIENPFLAMGFVPPWHQENQPLEFRNKTSV